MRDSPRAMIVTGASSGIGRALALLAARNGDRVLLVARRGARLAGVAQEIRANGGVCEALAIDVAAEDAPPRIVDVALKTFQRLDAVVNAAGGGAHGELLEQRDAAIEAQWRTHVAAPLRLARAALPQLERSRGNLVFFGSGVARVPLPAFGAYALAKAAIRAAAIQLRRELRPRGIAVTYVDPGVVISEFHQQAGVERPRLVAAVPAERVARAILRGMRRRAAVVNAVAWQTAGTIAGELFGSLADPVVAMLRMQRAADSIERLPERVPAPQPGPPPREPATADATMEAAPFDAALAPVARRMERVKLPPSFVREALVPGETLELNELAMRWAGMPNKNERAALREVLDTLASAGYLEPIGEETWNVIRDAERPT